MKWGRAGVISTIDPIFGVLTPQSLGFLDGTNSGFKVNTVQLYKSCTKLYDTVRAAGQ